MPKIENDKLFRLYSRQFINKVTISVDKEASDYNAVYPGVQNEIKNINKKGDGLFLKGKKIYIFLIHILLLDGPTQKKPYLSKKHNVWKQTSIVPRMNKYI